MNLFFIGNLLTEFCESLVVDENNSFTLIDAYHLIPVNSSFAVHKLSTFSANEEK